MTEVGGGAGFGRDFFLDLAEEVGFVGFGNGAGELEGDVGELAVELDEAEDGGVAHAGSGVVFDVFSGEVFGFPVEGGGDDSVGVGGEVEGAEGFGNVGVELNLIRVVFNDFFHKLVAAPVPFSVTHGAMWAEEELDVVADHFALVFVPGVIGGND